MSIRQWYYSVSGDQVGPIAEDDLVRMFQTGRLQPNTMVWTAGLKEWVEASSVEGLLPQQTPPPLPDWSYTPASVTVSYAGFWKRFAAAFIDSIILTFGALIVGFTFGVAYAAATAGTAQRAEFSGYIIGIIMEWLYAAIFESSSKQATLGKMALGIKVTDLGGNPISFGRATGRHFGKIVSTIIFFIGFLMVAFTEKKQGLHDIMSGCLVVNA